jgi:hypothetical protein
MSGVHKHPTISFRVSDREREMIEAKILASGMQKKDYFVRPCIYSDISQVEKIASKRENEGCTYGDGITPIKKFYLW